MNTFNKVSFLLILLSFVLITSCGDDEDNGPKYEFKNQSLQGQIEGEAWVFSSGIAEVSFFDETDLSFELSSETFEDPCTEFILDGQRLLFDVPATVGVYELSFTENGHTVTLYNPDTNLNSIAVSGAVEILTITETEVTGRIDARTDSETFANGNFTVPFCAD